MFLLAAFSSNAQVQNNDLVYIGDNGYVYVKSDTFYFGAGNGQTKTTRTPSVYGKLIFSSSTTASGASNTHFLDGYGSVISTSSFIFPIGQSGVYAPARVVPSTVIPVDAAFYRANPTTIGSTIDASVGAMSDAEYWHIVGNNTAVVSLSYRASSMLSNLAGNTSELTIVGYNGTKWIEIPSTVDATAFTGGNSTVTAGTITSSANVDLSTYSYFTVGAKASVCSPLIVSSGITKTWNGSWSPSAPTIADPVVIAASYANGSFQCNSLVLNANATLQNGQYIEVVNGVTGSGKIIMSSEANFVQRASDATAPNIELTKTTRNIMRRYDYVYWGTPIAGDFFSQLSNAQACNGTAQGAFDLKYRYVNGAGGGWQQLASVVTGQGFIMRVKPQAPFISANATDCINLKFTGVANNGNVIVPITNNLGSPNGGSSHALLANPYPSALDAYEFLTANNDIDGALYIWTSATGNVGVNNPYTQADYIVYTLAGAVVPNSVAGSFEGRVASGQSFRVKSLTNAGSVTFTNCMRLKEGNDKFYRVNKPETKLSTVDRYKLTMTGANGVFSQILVAYMPQATLGYDRLYDAGRNSVSTAQLYSIFEGDGRKLAINARPTFFDTDKVALGVSKGDTALENFTVSISDQEGIFSTNLATVYLHDKVNGTYTDLSMGSYTFSADAKATDNRFELVYQNPKLSNDDFVDTNVYAFAKNQSLTVSSKLDMSTIEVYDITGRKILESKIDNAKTFTSPFSKAQAVYLLKIKLVNGKIATLKVINQD